jgi:hypothetical protein
MNRKIVWSSQHLEIDTLTGRLKEQTHFIDNSDTECDELAEIENVISTPFGIWRVDDVMNPYKQFKLWMGHTNFTINKKIVNIIKKTPGVEVLSILTRYRFLIGVGELFNIRDVRISIEQTLNCIKENVSEISNPKLKNEIDSLKEMLSSYKKWAIYVFPNGSIDFVTDSDNKHFVETLNIYKKSVQYSAGILIENTNE